MEDMGDEQCSSAVDCWWNQLSNLYNEPHRAYHNLNHLRELFEWYDRFESIIEPEKRLIVQFSIFFHDVVYNPKASDSEEMLQELLAKDSNKAQNLKENVVKYTLYTKNHTEHSHEMDYSLKLFLDFDLNILRSTETRYNEYSNQVRQEYIHVPFELFCEKRAELLQKMLSCMPSETSDGLQNKNLYYTNEIITLYGAKAWKNTERELCSLKMKKLL
jgi:predicted metal-dependent HD superfamily phosphohydrolase